MSSRNLPLLKKRYDKAVALEKLWTRKAKLAATKLKGYRKAIKRYEKLFATL